MKFIYTLAALLLSASITFGQSIAPVIGSIDHNDMARTCLVVNVEPGAAAVEDAWKDFIKDKYGVKMGGAGFLGTGSLLEAEEVVIAAVSPKTMDFYTNIEKKDEQTEIKVFAAFGYDMYVSPTETPEEYKAMRKMLITFLDVYLPKYYNKEIAVAAKSVKQLNKSKEKLAKSIAKNEKKMKKLDEELAETKKEQEKNTEALNEANETLKKRRSSLESILKQLNKING